MSLRKAPSMRAARAPRMAVAILVLALSPCLAHAQIAFDLLPRYILPAGDNAGAFDYHRYGFTGALRFLFGKERIFVDFLGGYDYSLLVTNRTIDELTLGAGIGLAFPLAKGPALRLGLGGGFCKAALSTPFGAVSGASGWFRLSLAADYTLGKYFDLGPRLALRLDGNLGPVVELGLGIAFVARGGGRPATGSAVPEPLVGKAAEPASSPSAQPAAPAPTGPSVPGTLAVEGAVLGTLFPVFYKYYDDHAFGAVRVTNGGTQPARDLVLSFYLKQYMDGPDESARLPVLAPGETAELPVKALLTDDILEVTEGTKAQAEIKVSASVGKERIERTQAVSVRVADRNAMTWLDDRAAAAFVTAKDPAVLGFAKATVGGLKSSMNPAVNSNLQAAMAIHEALGVYGLGYLVDPKSAYGSAAVGSTTVDFLLFPRQTLEYRGGDCDDLAILYCALLECVGLDMAFVTVPGHIFVAASLGLSPEEAKKTFRKVDDLILRDDGVWLPIEVTARQSGFLDAWQAGAKEWRESRARGEAGFFPIAEAWSTFEPVGLPGSTAIQLPDAAKVATRFSAEAARFVDREIAEDVARIQSQLRASPEDPKLRNDLGVLYARYGLFDRAKSEFQKAVTKKEYTAAILNLGNLAFRQKDFESALSDYERAFKSMPGSPIVVLALARANWELENYGAVKKHYASLQSMDPVLAEKYSYLGSKGEEGSRAAELSGAREALEWMQ